MFPFPLELTIYIASLDQKSWITIARHCSDFHKYAYTDIGGRQFLDLFTDINVTSCETTYSIFGKLHRDNDKPAAIRKDGTQRWYINGKLHRDGDKPAVIYASGTQCWYKNGKRHRSEARDKPAIIYADGTQFWYKNGICIK